MLKKLIQNEAIKGLYLDDQSPYFALAKDALYDTNYEITETESIEFAEKKSIDNSYSFLLCDLWLRDITAIDDGYEILRRIRKVNKTIFLALFTTYSHTLLDEKKQKLRQEKIKIYSKDDLQSFRKNLEKDFINFKEYNLKAEELIKSLGSIENPEITIQVSQDKAFTSKELAYAIMNRTEEGIEFFESWLYGLRRKKNKK